MTKYMGERERKGYKKTYGDEIIAKVLNQYKTEVYGDIYSGIYIQEDLYRFACKEIYPNELSMQVPIRFREIKGKEIGIFSPEQCDVIYISPKGNIQLSFVKIEGKSLDDENEVLADIMSKAKIINPSIHIRDMGVCNTENIEGLKYVEYTVPYGSSNIYILLFAIDKSGKLYIGKCSCNVQQSQLWRVVFGAMLGTLRSV